ncbi:MAG: type II toxin-antitoxin system VapC family toxin [Verrucomicrobiales bacterium]|nr:type II toxin-antitoxin system VapC family toxin [Verrucomicrobiales bacterium]
MGSRSGGRTYPEDSAAPPENATLTIAYADSSFPARVYTPHAASEKALGWMRKAKAPLPFTLLHRLELRNAIRLRVFRGEIGAEQRKRVLLELEADLDSAILAHTPIPWTEAFREAEELGAKHTEDLGVSGMDLLHVGIAIALEATDFLTFDARQGVLVKAAGLRVGRCLVGATSPKAKILRRPVLAANPRRPLRFWNPGFARSRGFLGVHGGARAVFPHSRRPSRAVAALRKRTRSSAPVALTRPDARPRTPNT